MGLLERIDKNLDPELARLWLSLAWYQEFGVTFEEVLP